MAVKNVHVSSVTVGLIGTKYKSKCCVCVCVCKVPVYICPCVREAVQHSLSVVWCVWHRKLLMGWLDPPQQPLCQQQICRRREGWHGVFSGWNNKYLLYVCNSIPSMFSPLRRSFSVFSACCDDEEGRRRIIIKFRFGSRVERLWGNIYLTKL